MSIAIPDGEQWMQEAGREAAKALCQRDKCGAVIVSAQGKIIGRGYNAPPGDDTTAVRCQAVYGPSPKPKSDRTCCLHAEWRAIFDAVKNNSDLIPGASLYFIRLNSVGQLSRSGMPYCTVCSRLALDVGLAQFVLWHEQGITAYNCKEYNELSYAFHD